MKILNLKNFKEQLRNSEQFTKHQEETILNILSVNTEEKEKTPKIEVSNTNLKTKTVFKKLSQEDIDNLLKEYDIIIINDIL